MALSRKRQRQQVNRDLGKQRENKSAAGRMKKCELQGRSKQNRVKEMKGVVFDKAQSGPTG